MEGWMECVKDDMKVKRSVEGNDMSEWKNLIFVVTTQSW